MPDNPEPARPLPEPDDISAPFWEAARREELVVQRCGDCRTYAHPPAPVCVTCLSENQSFEPVSGKAVIVSFTEVHAGARHPYFVAKRPYLVGLVELREQEGLLMFTNFCGVSLEELTIDSPVSVVFEKVSEDVVLPQFRLDPAAQAAS